MKTQKLFSRILDGLTLLVFILFFASAGFQDRSTSGWYQQWLPNLNGSTIQSMTFLDSLTGFAVTNPGTSIYCYILKTTNGGDNWTTNYTYNSGTNIRFTKVQFADNNIGYASTNFFDFFKTTNAGLNWTQLANPDGAEDMAVINKDTIMVVTSDGFAGGVYRSTSGGINWQYIWNNSPNGNPSKIYMYDKNFGFTQDGSNYMRRTTNGGFNWSLITGEFFSSIKFFDSNTGWKVFDSLRKTTNSGLNWVTQKTPSIAFQYSNSTEFTTLTKDSIWMVGARKFGKPPVYKTTNGGINWGYQFPDTTLQIYSFSFIQFVNAKVGWVNPASPTSLLHTTIGGNDTTYITNINSNVNIELSDYQLFQNYPNPFNSISKIKYKIVKSSNARIEIMNILGKNIQTFVNKKQSPGTYEINFNGENLGSGIYFYSLIIDGKIADTKRMIMIK